MRRPASSVQMGILVGLIVTGGAWPALGDDNVAATRRYAAAAHQIATMIKEQIADKDIPALSIALVDDQRVVWAQGFGLEDPKARKPATARTVYRVGSVSKLFTDIAVLQLVDEGKLDLDRPLTEYLPDFKLQGPPPETPLTLRQLMSHRSGLVREPPVGHYFDPTEPGLENTVKSLNETSLIYAPQTRTKYSNAGIAVVGYVLEKQQSGSFEEILDRGVLATLGMSESSFALTHPIKQRLADAVMWSYDGRTFPAPPFAIGTAPAGNLYSNVLDLSKFAQSIFNGGQGEQGRLLKEETLREMMRPQFSRTGGFGLGFHIQRLDGHLKIGHGGAVYGFSTQFELLPEQKIGVIAAASKDVTNGLVHRITDHALRCMLAVKNDQPLPPLQRTAPVGLERARLLDGRYRHDSTGDVVTLVERNGRLWMDHGSARKELRRLDNTLIVDDVQQFGMRVLPGNGGLRIGNRHFGRLPATRPKLMPGKWQGLVGEYGWDHNTLFVYEDLGQLRCLIEWVCDYPLTEVDENTFAFPNYGLYHGERLLFDRGADGQAQRVTAAEVVFERRHPGIREGETFKITPVKAVDEIREIALAGKPPAEQRRFRRPDLVEIAKLDPSIKLDIRYASTNNFMGSVFYQQPRAFLQRPAAEALVRVQRKLRTKGFGLLIYDAYRPWYVTKMFWEATPEDMKIFVANPDNGSRHNRGCAVDLTIVDLESGQPIPMGAGYDEFSSRSFPDYPVTSSRIRWNRELLRDAMESEGFTIYEFEWWHFDYKDWKNYGIMNKQFEEIEQGGR